MLVHVNQPATTTKTATATATASTATAAVAATMYCYLIAHFRPGKKNHVNANQARSESLHGTLRRLQDGSSVLSLGVAVAVAVADGWPLLVP